MAKFDWTNIDVDALKAEYVERREAGESNAAILADLTEKYGIGSERRLRGKLMVEQVYVKDTDAEKAAREMAKPKDRKPRVTKAMLAAEIVEKLGFGKADDFAKLTKDTLTKLLDYVNKDSEAA